MSLNNYAELKAAVAGFLNKTNLTAAIPDFIRLAEARLNRDLDCRQMVETMDLTLDGEDLYLPNNFAGVLSFRIEGPPNVALEYVTPDALDDSFGRAGKPCRYTITDRIVLDPTPDGEYTARLRYRKRLCPMTLDSDCNWLLTMHPDAYLYGALMQAAPYLRDDVRLGVWGGLYGDAVAAINADDKRQAQPATLNARGRVFK